MTPRQSTAARRQSGLVTLGPEETVLLRTLDGLFERWGLEAGAASMTMPPLVPVASLVNLGYYENFPHQAMLAAGLDLRDGPPAIGGGSTAIAPEALAPAGLALPPAACYGVYLDLEGTAVEDGTAVTIVGRCFRKEEHYDGLRRLFGFHMREVVRLGSRPTTDKHLDLFTERTLGLAAELELPMSRVPATDPFYDSGGSKALMQRLYPVKYEFVVDDLAIASTNVHRNFFGERCSITLAGSGETATTSCVAFGLERWISVLVDRYGAAGATARLTSAERNS
ncbi:MAG: hypothetical protein M3548_05735 [Actinomycetota bacterium]|nr:hypothetical protein [Actinomycetota bacterium]